MIADGRSVRKAQCEHVGADEHGRTVDIGQVDVVLVGKEAGEVVDMPLPTEVARPHRVGPSRGEAEVQASGDHPVGDHGAE